VLELIREGLGFDQITRDYYPDLEAGDLRACVQYAMDVLAADQKTGHDQKTGQL
jgi:uncharacterized protein (DUF433 family)